MNFKKNISPICFYLCVLVFVLYSVGPIIWMLLSSLRSKVEFFNIPPTIFPKQFTFINYILLFRETNFIQFLLNSVYVTIGTIFTSVLVSTLAAYSLTRFNYRGRNLFTIFSLFAYMLPAVLLVIPLYLFAVKAGLANKLTGLILAYIALCLPYCIWMMRAFFRSIPIEFEEAAFVDGAGRLRILFNIVIPMALPGVISTTVFIFIFVWNEYLFALIFMSSDLKLTFPVGLNNFVTQFDTYWEYILSGSVIVSIPALIIFLLTQKSLIKGWGGGGIKG
ncbi:MAG: carbohydrate ABC transporter permease [Atribacterota bacterium]